MRIEYHRTLLTDRVRNQAFHDALRRVIVPGKTIVADIGSGTGFLGFLAARLGAKRVYLIERGEIVDVARKLARANGIRNIEIVPAHSTDVTPPKLADVVVSETVGNYPFEENIIETLSDARSRYLAPGGVIIPDHVTQYVVPVTGETIWRELAAWDEIGFDLDFSVAKRMSMNNIYVRRLAPRDLWDGGRAAVAFDAVDLANAASTTRRGVARWPAASEHGRRVYGLALWWHVRLHGEVALSTGPHDPPTHWEQLFLPLAEPIDVPAGSALEATIRSTTSYEAGTNLTWRIVCKDARGKVVATQAMDLERGFIP